MSKIRSGLIKKNADTEETLRRDDLRLGAAKRGILV